MKKDLLLIAFFVISVCCIWASNSKIDFDNIPSSDSTCLNEIRAAKIDISNGKLMYCRYAGSMLYIFFRSAKEFESQLKKYNIGYKNVLLSDRVIPGQTQGCYMNFMNQAIEKKFGLNFIDSLKNVADELFVKRHINGCFSYRDCDVQPKFPGDTSLIRDEGNNLFQRDFESICYPVDYLRRPNGREYWSTIAFVDVHLLVDKHGNANILDYEFRFDNTKNHEFEPFLKKEISRILKKKNWSSGIIRNQKVTSDCYKRIYLK